MIVAETVGEQWLQPHLFRFGASSLLDDISNVLAGGESKTASSGY